MKHTMILAGLAACCAACLAADEIRTTPGDLRTHATNYCIGVEWDITGDKNHNAVCQVRFRPKGETAWRMALDLFRTDYYGWWKSRKSLAKRPYNMLAGSILFLRPGAEYEVELSMADPDGGAGKKNFTIRTRPWPAIPKGGEAHHVRAAAEIAQAQESAQPGDTILLHKGAYGVFGITKPGKPGRYIVWKAAEEGVVFEQIAVSASHV